MPWRVVVAFVGVGMVAGAIVGFVRGLHYTPTLVFAIGEGAILFGVPAGLLGLLVGACWALTTTLRRRAQIALNRHDREAR